LQGAGGIGGLAFVRDYTTTGTGTYFPAYDGNGNIIAMIKSSNSSVAANYEYNLYGQLLTWSGAYSTLNPFRFSTKFVDNETNFSYFGYRHYNPDMGRWLNRDPIEEWGGKNIYMFTNNLPINKFDYLGLLSSESPSLSSTCCLSNNPSGKGTGTPRLRCRPVDGLVGLIGSHCYIELVDEDGARTGVIGAGPDEKGKLIGWENGFDMNRGGNTYPIFIDGSPCKFIDCLRKTMKEFNDENSNYNPLGPNCNTFASKLIERCGGKASFPISAIGAIYMPDVPNLAQPPWIPYQPGIGPGLPYKFGW
jgi:RHS repeat-associated protein